MCLSWFYTLLQTLATAEDGRRQAFGLDVLTPDEYTTGWISLLWKFVLPWLPKLAIYFITGLLTSIGRCIQLH